MFLHRVFARLIVQERLTHVSEATGESHSRTTDSGAAKGCFSGWGVEAESSVANRYAMTSARIQKCTLCCAQHKMRIQMRANTQGQAYLARLEKKHGKGKTLTVLAHKLARAVYPMLWRKQAFDMKRFLNR